MRKFIDIIRRLPLCEGAGRTNFGFVNKLEWVYRDVFSGVPPSDRHGGVSEDARRPPQ